MVTFGTRLLTSWFKSLLVPQIRQRIVAQLTWGHIECRSTAKVRCDKSSSLAWNILACSLLSNHNGRSSYMAVLHCIQKLKENLLGQEVISNKVPSLGNVVKKITLQTVLNLRYICAIRSLKDVYQGDNVLMGTNLVVKSNLPLLKAPLHPFLLSIGPRPHMAYTGTYRWQYKLLH